MAANALAVARHLEGHNKVGRVCYPGLASDVGHDVAVQQLNKGFGGVLAFDVGDTQKDAMKFISALKVIFHAVSLGATESLICIPYLTTMLYMPAERRTSFGVKANTVRLSVGIDRTEALLEDIEQSL